MLALLPVMFLFMCVVMCIFFFKQKTAYEMRISDWSSDVCSSDLQRPSSACTSQIHSAMRADVSRKPASPVTEKISAQPHAILPFDVDSKIWGWKVFTKKSSFSAASIHLR